MSSIGFRLVWQWVFICVLLVCGLVATCWGQEWKTCIRQDVKATRGLVGHRILNSVNCPPGVSGECFVPGPKWDQFSFGKQSRTGPCQYAVYPASECRGWKGQTEICGVAADWFGPPRFPFSFIHSSKPPVVLYVKKRIRSPDFDPPNPKQINPKPINVISGTYGWNCMNVNPTNGSANRVFWGNVTGHLRAACDGWLGSCTYTIDYTQIGDPCFGCVKNYIAEWTCGSDPTIHKKTVGGPPEAGFGMTITLDCP